MHQFNSKIEDIKNLFNIFYTLDKTGLITAIIEMFIISLIVYYILLWIKNTRAWTLLKGVLIIVFCFFLTWFFQFRVLFKIIEMTSVILAVALIIVFQDNLRAGLEKLGRQNVFSKILPGVNKFTKKTSENIVQEIAIAAFAMARVKTGALIVIEQTESLEDVEKTGISLEAKVSKQLLINIFEKNTPLHDGAVLIVGDTIKAATCYLPLSSSKSIPKEYGTRHRAALGVSEISDSETIVVSEQTGNVSICFRGELRKVNDEKELIRELVDTIYKQEGTKKKTIVGTMKGWFANDKKA